MRGAPLSDATHGRGDLPVTGAGRGKMKEGWLQQPASEQKETPRAHEGHEGSLLGPGVPRTYSLVLRCIASLQKLRSSHRCHRVLSPAYVSDQPRLQQVAAEKEAPEGFMTGFHLEKARSPGGCALYLPGPAHSSSLRPLGLWVSGLTRSKGRYRNRA